MWIYKVHFNDFNRENANACNVKDSRNTRSYPWCPKHVSTSHPAFWRVPGHGAVTAESQAPKGPSRAVGTALQLSWVPAPPQIVFFQTCLKTQSPTRCCFQSVVLIDWRSALAKSLDMLYISVKKHSVGRIHAICYSHKKLYILQFIFRLNSSFYCLSFITLYFWHSKFSRAKVSRKWVTLGQKLWCPLKWGSLDNAHKSSFSLKGFLGFGGGVFFPQIAFLFPEKKAVWTQSTRWKICCYFYELYHWPDFVTWIAI